MSYRSYRELIETEKARFCNAPLTELRNISVALSIHSFGNTLEEKARLDAIKSLISERSRAKRKASRCKSDYMPEWRAYAVTLCGQIFEWKGLRKAQAKWRFDRLKSGMIWQGLSLRQCGYTLEERN
jgi:hypothetical protein